MRRLIFAAVVMAIAVLASALPAYADNVVLTVGSAGGTAVANGDSLTANLQNGSSNPATFKSTTNNNTVSCSTSTFNATAGNNPAPPGPASESLTQQTFGGCTTNFGASINSFTIDHLPYNVAVSSPNGGNNVTLSPGSNGNIHATVKATLIFTITCQYKVHDSSGDLFGQTSNTDNSITFTNQQFDLDVGSSLCIQHVNFSAKYGPVQDATQNNGNVFTN